MPSIPHFAQPVFAAFVPCFTAPTLERFIVLALSAIITLGSHTVSNLVRTLGPLLDGHPTTYNHVVANRKWAIWSLARVFATLLIETFVSEGVIRLVGDDTVIPHPGRKVYGKGRHRDAVRSSHSYTAFHYGHKWVVLCLLVRLPFCRRAWALPILVALYRTEKWNKEHGKRHRTPPEIMEDLLAVILRWFPSRRFVLVGDGGFGTHRLAKFAHKHRKQLALISRFYPDAALHELPPLRQPKQNGRPRVKGKRLPSPEQIVASAQERQRLTVDWYGGERRDIEVVTGVGHWYKSGQGLVEIRWVYVKDLTGTHRDEYFFTTDVALNAQAVVEGYASRWNVETTFQELHAHIKIGSTRCRTENSVLHQVPCLFALYSLVVLLYTKLNPGSERIFAVQWPGKVEVTFSDAIATVRRALWREWVFKHPTYDPAFEKIPPDFRETLLNFLAMAA